MARRAYEQLLATLRESPGAPAGVLGMLVILYWAASDGGFDPLVYLPSTLFLVGLVLVVAVTAPGSLPGGRAGLVAFVSLAGFVGWCFLTILWADVPADAWSGANKTLAFFAVYALFALRPWRPVTAGAVLAIYALGVAAIGLNELLTIARAADPGLAGFVAGRLAQPITYSNANCALYLSAAIPALFFASRRQSPVALRAASLAAVGILADLAVLCQSRTSLLIVPLVALAYLVLVPGRLRSILAMSVVGSVVALSAGTLLEVYSALLSGVGQHAAVVDARRAVLVGGAVLLVAGAVWGLVDRLVVVPARVMRMAHITVVCVGLVAAVAGAGAFVDRFGDPVSQGRDWWQQFKADEDVESADTPHFVSGFGSGRYELWRVATNIFLRHPVGGIGVDNFAVDYLRERRNDSNPLYPHSFVLRTLQQTGVIGAVLLLAFGIGVGIAAWGALRRGDHLARGLAGTALALAGYWATHGAVDWLWEIPVLSAAAFGALGLAVGLSPVSAGPRMRRAAAVAAVVLGAATVVTAVPPWLAARNTDAALHSWRADPDLAYDRLDRARALNPLSAEPDVFAAVIAAQLGDVARQRAFLLRAVGRNPHDWYPRLELGAIEARRGKRQEALLWLDSAQELNPRDWLLRFVAQRVRVDNPLTQVEIDELFERRGEWLTRERQS